MTGLEIAALVYDKPENTTVSKLEGEHDEKEIPVGLKDTIKIHECEKFKVIRNDVNAGFQSRIEREIALLRENGVNVTLLTEPVPAVVFLGYQRSPDIRQAVLTCW